MSMIMCKLFVGSKLFRQWSILSYVKILFIIVSAGILCGPLKGEAFGMNPKLAGTQCSSSLEEGIVYVRRGQGYC